MNMKTENNKATESSGKTKNGQKIKSSGKAKNEQEIKSNGKSVNSRKSRVKMIAGMAVLMAACAVFGIALGMYFNFGKTAGNSDRNVISENDSGVSGSNNGDVESSASDSEDDVPEDKAADKKDDAEISEEEAWVQEQLQRLTTEEKVAQLFIITPETLTGVDVAVAAGDATRNSIYQYPVGGFVYFSGNIQSGEQVMQMLLATQQYSMERIGLPVFTCIDEEGGTVARIGNSGITGIPLIEDMSQVTDPQRAYTIGQTLGSYLSQYGFNLDFAPVADVLSNPSNTVVWNRSFGPDCNQVSVMVQQVLNGLNDYGVYGAVKHFPGHGATAGDTHEGYAYTDKTLDQMMTNEMIPFAQAIQNGVKFVMVGHISVPGITGDGTPSSLSYTVVTDILRNQLGFEGLVVTDALNMGAISQNYSAADTAVMAIGAGCDLLLMPSDFYSAYQGVLNAIYDGRISLDRLNESVARILRVKKALM